MENRKVDKKLEIINAPSVLRKGVEVYRVGKEDGVGYIVRLPWEKSSFQLEVWQFFVLEALPKFEDFNGLNSAFQTHFGHALAQKDFEAFLAFIDSKQIFSATSQELPLLASVTNWTSAQNMPKATTLVSGKQALKGGGMSESKSGAHRLTPIIDNSDKSVLKVLPDPVSDTDANVPGGDVPGATEPNDPMWNRGFKLFKPTWLLRMVAPLLYPLRHLIYLLPLMIISAVYISVEHRTLLLKSLVDVFFSITLVQHALLTLITLNVAVTLLTCVFVYNSKAIVSGISLVFTMIFFPRIGVHLSNTQQLTRKELIWLNLSPLLLRLGFFSGGILLWHFTHTRNHDLGVFSLIIAAAGGISFFITANPLVKSNGFNMLSAFVNEPHLKGKTFHAFMSKFSGKVYSHTENNVLVAFMLASLLFMLAFAVVMIYLLEDYLKQYFDKGSILVILIIGLVLLWRITMKFRQFGQYFERADQFRQWRDRTLPQKETEVLIQEKTFSAKTWVQRSVLVILGAAMFLPCKYEVSGDFTILPFSRQNIATDIAGIIEAVNFDGGEFIRKGEEIGHLSTTEFRAQEKIYSAKMEQQKETIQKLKSEPRHEDLEVARSELETQKTRAAFSKAKFERLSDLNKKGAVSVEDLENARRDYEVDRDGVAEKLSKFNKVKAGADPDEIAAAVAQLQAFQEERDYYRECIANSILTMPFDGLLITMNLKNKIGSFLNKGESLAMVQNADTVKAEIKIPESNVSAILAQAPIRIRPQAYVNQELKGTVLSIDRNVTDQESGNVIKVISLIKNPDDVLKTGMTGYAKIESIKMPLWRVFSTPVLRFAKVEMWSWLP
jgi:putative peptide zinc metalloprotease protein